MRNTGNDTAAMTMFNRENKVSQWIGSDMFKALAA